jgi:hypothetical protein
MNADADMACELVMEDDTVIYGDVQGFNRSEFLYRDIL